MSDSVNNQPSLAPGLKDGDAIVEPEDGMGQFFYEDSTIRILVGDVKFQVSRRLLISTSEVFADMFTLQAPEDEERQEIVLHNDPEDFRCFLWFLHVDVLSMERYNASASQQTRFHRALGIASVAHMYSATNVFAWAIAELLKYLANHRHSQELMTRAYRLAVRVVDNPILLSTVRREWIKGLEDSDPVNMLTAAKSVGDHGLLGCAYFAILQTKTNGWIANEPSLNSLDRARLMVGALNLRHWERSRPIAKASQASTSAIKVSFANSISKVFDLPAMATWDPQKLWDLFTQSAFGLSFEHDADLSAHDARPPHSAQQTA